MYSPPCHSVNCAEIISHSELLPPAGGSLAGIHLPAIFQPLGVQCIILDILTQNSAFIIINTFPTTSMYLSSNDQMKFEISHYTGLYKFS